MLFLSFINIKYYFSLSIVFYILILLLLISATFFGTTVQGSQRWINLYFINLQPSELMKIAIIIFLARYYHRVQPDAVKQLKVYYSFCNFNYSNLISLKSARFRNLGLIALSGIAVIWLAGINIKYIVYSFLGLVFHFHFNLNVKTISKIENFNLYQSWRRSTGCRLPNHSVKNCSWLRRFNWQRFFKGHSRILDFLPEKHTDFVYIIFEEFGFVGSVILLILYAFIIIRILLIGSNSRNYFGKFFCYGFAISIFFYISVNMLMVLGMLPIVGSPLPIMSYGGSSMLSMMIALGIVMSTRIYSKEIIN